MKRSHSNLNKVSQFFFLNAVASKWRNFFNTIMRGYNKWRQYEECTKMNFSLNQQNDLLYYIARKELILYFLHLFENPWKALDWVKMFRKSVKRCTALRELIV